MRPWQKRLALGAIGLVVAGSLWRIIGAEDRMRSFAEDAIGELIERGLYSADCTLILERALSLLSVIDPEFNKFSVNKPPAEDGYSLVVVNPGTHNYSPQQTQILSSSRGNMMAVGKRFIVIDEALLAKLALNARLTFSSELQVEERSRASDSTFGATEKRRTFSMTSMIRYANTSALEADNDFWLGTVKAFNATRGAKTIGEYTSALKEAGFAPLTIAYPLDAIIVFDSLGKDRPAQFPFADIIAAPIAAAIAPFLLHELGHLHTGYQGAFVGQTVADVKKNIQQRYVEEELRADRFAIDRIHSWKASGRNFLTLGGYRYDMGRNMYVSGKMLEDLALQEKLDQFRGINTQSLGSQIIYNDRDCNDSIRGFFDVNLIADIREVLLPILTDSELDAISQVDRAKTSTHPHLYARAREFQRLSTSELAATYEPESTHASSVRQLLASDTAQLASKALRQAYIKDIERIFPNGLKSRHHSAEQLDQRFLSFGFTSQTPSACPFDKCTLLTSNSHTQIEVGERNGKVIYLTAYFRTLSTRPKVRDGPWGEQSADSIRAFAEKMGALGTLLKVLSDGEVDLASKVFENYLHRHVTCGFGSVELAMKSSLILISSTDNDKSVLLTYQAR